MTARPDRRKGQDAKDLRGSESSGKRRRAAEDGADWFHIALQEAVAKERRGYGARATVTESRGSAPRRAGARMIVGQRRAGTLGPSAAGRLEHSAGPACNAGTGSRESRRLANIISVWKRRPELGMDCGGSVSVHYQ